MSDDDRIKVSKEIRSLSRRLGDRMDGHELANYLAYILDPDDKMTWSEIANKLADLIAPEPDDPGSRDLASAWGWR